MKNRTRLFLILILCACMISTTVQKDTVPASAQVIQRSQIQQTPLTINHQSEPVYILLFIGDGMGSEHRKAAQWVEYGINGLLHMDRLSVQGWSQTASANAAITDSAAGATAIATGIRTNNGMISLSPDQQTLKTVLEYAQEKGLATGLVSTVQITHATPAAFATHVTSRTMMNEIALQLIENNGTVLLGGGEDEFLPNGVTGCYPQSGERIDNRNLISEAAGLGYTTLCTETQLNDLDTTVTQQLLGLFADEGMQRPFTPSLEVMTTTAIEVLKNDPQGFFLMVEGGQIDWASHDNDAWNAIQDTIDFDDAVKIGMDFLQTQENGILIVTADHETGGMQVHLTPNGSPDEDGPFYSKEGIPFYVRWGTTSHTADNVPITAIGQGALLLNSIIPNTNIFWALTWPIFPHIYLPAVNK